MKNDDDTLLEGCQEAKADSAIVFDFKRQAWFPDDGKPLDKNRTAKATLKADVRFETKIGIRSSDAEFQITDRFDPKK
jgi:hypothetical protein